MPDNSRKYILLQALKKNYLPYRGKLLSSLGELKNMRQSIKQLIMQSHPLALTPLHAPHPNPTKDKKANPEIECFSTFLSREFRGREVPLLYGHVMKALPSEQDRI